MSESSVDSTISEQDGKNRDKSSTKLTKYLRTLFCCFKYEPRVEEIIEYDSDEYDYIIEKLIVKRVPLALLAIPSHLQDRRRQTPSTVSSQSTSLSTVSGNNSTAHVVTQTTSMKMTDKECDFSKTLRSEKDDDQISFMKRGAMNRFSSPHPDLKKSEESFEDSLSFSQNGQSLAEDTFETSMRTDVSSRNTSSAIIQNDMSMEGKFIRHGFSNPFSRFASKRNEKSRLERNDNSNKLQNTSPEKIQENFISGFNRRYVVSPFRVKRGSFLLAKPRDIADGIGSKSLEYIEESLEDRSTKSEDSKNHQESPSKVRWRITIRHRYADANSKAVASKV